MRPTTCELFISCGVAVFLTNALCRRQGRRRRDVVAMVRRQQDRWPFKEGRKRFTSKTNMTQMRAVLLNPTYGFTKQVVPTLTQITTPPSDAGPAGGVGPRPQPLPELLPATPGIVVPPPSLSPQLGAEDAAGAELAGDGLDLGSRCTPLRARLSGSENSSGQALSRSASEDRMTVHPQVGRSCLLQKRLSGL
jgi:hypothetical protein